MLACRRSCQGHTSGQPGVAGNNCNIIIIIFMMTKPMPGAHPQCPLVGLTTGSPTASGQLPRPVQAETALSGKLLQPTETTFEAQNDRGAPWNGPALTFPTDQAPHDQILSCVCPEVRHPDDIDCKALSREPLRQLNNWLVQRASSEQAADSRQSRGQNTSSSASAEVPDSCPVLFHSWPTRLSVPAAPPLLWKPTFALPFSPAHHPTLSPQPADECLSKRHHIWMIKHSCSHPAPGLPGLYARPKTRSRNTRLSRCA